MKAILLFTAALLCTFSMRAQDDLIPNLTEKQKADAVAVALNWTRKLTEGKDINGVIALSSLPFVKDGNLILTTPQQLKDFYSEVVKDKGQRPGATFSAAFDSYRYEILDKCIPVDFIVVKIQAEIDTRKDEILISVANINGTYKVSGFKD
jgi:hypothetical protein